MSEKMVRTQVYLPADIYQQLKERGEREGLTLAHQIREALAEYVAAADQDDEELPVLSADDPIWNIVGMVESGVTDGSVNHDKYIYARDWDPPENDR